MLPDIPKAVSQADLARVKAAADGLIATAGEGGADALAKAIYAADEANKIGSHLDLCIALAEATGQKFVMLGGNCQMKPLRHVLKWQNPLNSERPATSILSFINALVPPPDAPIWRHVECLIYQPNTKWLPDDALDPRISRLKLPALACSALWPYFRPSKLKTDDDGRLYGYSYSDTFIEKCLKQGKAAEDIVQEYLNHDFEGGAICEAVKEFTFEQFHHTSKGADIDLASFVISRWRSERLFRTPNHPDAAVLEFTAKATLELLGADADLSGFSGLYLQMANMEHPVHPAVGAHFGMPFYGKEARFATRSGDLATFSEFVPRFISGEFERPGKPRSEGLAA